MPKLKTKHSVIHCRVRTWRASRMLISIYSPSTIALLVLLLVSWFCSVKGARERVEIIEDDAYTTHCRRYVHLVFLLLPRRLFLELRC
ncbi:unnamed protein product, partial [Vitis vinifera]|uniref:Uncharacterized protein n=1 Tax=Vitis vinifera TaxID=29760 RepID=D7U894_VITVI